MLERTDVITKEVLEPITFVLEYPTVLFKIKHKLYIASGSAPSPKKDTGRAPHGFGYRIALYK
jgi:hypothetical protein